MEPSLAINAVYELDDGNVHCRDVVQLVDRDRAPSMNGGAAGLDIDFAVQMVVADGLDIGFGVRAVADVRNLHWEVIDL